MPIVSRGETDLYYEVHGREDGPGLVFAHGAGGNAASWWQQVPAFADRYRIVVFDHRGFARSPCPPGEQVATEFEDDLIAVMDDAGLEKAHLVCQSMGGWTGARAAVKYPSRIGGVLLANTPGAIETQETRANLHVLRQRIQNAGGLGGLAISQEFITRWPAGGLLYKQLSAFNAGNIPDIADPAVCVSPEQVTASGVPFWVLASDLDPLFPDAMLKSVAAAIGAEYRHVAGAGHSTYFEMPDAFNGIVAAFLAAT
ncbi:MAG: alpha/beta fold hydrolase [Minwuia sp.]|uniref:alpha/beta fold hydrolase n=1 Tax=Minwuia sp. TaxID=2493630 RepID=UPI003A890280